jgi:hypothetical protein
LEDHAPIQFTRNGVFHVRTGQVPELPEHLVGVAVCALQPREDAPDHIPSEPKTDDPARASRRLKRVVDAVRGVIEERALLGKRCFANPRRRRRLPRITEAVRALLHRFDFMWTAGGLGPEQAVAIRQEHGEL